MVKINQQPHLIIRIKKHKRCQACKVSKHTMEKPDIDGSKEVLQNKTLRHDASRRAGFLSRIEVFNLHSEYRMMLLP